MNELTFANEKSIRIIQNFEELKELRYFWEANQWHPFSDFDYFQFAGKIEDFFIKPFMCVLFKNGEINCLIIGRIINKSINWKLGYKNIFQKKLPCLDIIYGGLLGDLSAENAKLIIKAIYASLKKENVDIVYLNHLQEQTSILTAAKKSLGVLLGNLPTYNYAHHYLKLPETYEQFVQQRSPNTKNNIKKYHNRMIKNFGKVFSIQNYSQPNEIANAMSDIEIIAQKTYHRKLGADFSHSEETRKKWEFNAQRNMFRAYVLYINEKPVAFWIGLLYKKVFYIMTTGFDPDYQYYHPGLFLLLNVFKRLCNDPSCEAVDFGFGEADYKRMFSTDMWWESELYLFAATKKGFQLKLIKTFIDANHLIAEKVLKKLKIFSLIKRL